MGALGSMLHDAAPALLTVLVRCALLLALAALVARLLRGTSASVRHLVWASALSAVLILPLAPLVVPSVALPILPDELTRGRQAPAVALASTGLSRATLPDDSSALPPADVHAPVPSRARSASADGPADAATGRSEAGVLAAWTWRSAAVLGWAIVALVMLGEIARSRLRLRRLAAGAWRVHDPAWWRAAARIRGTLGIRQPVTLLATTNTRVPLTWGIRSPVVLLPADAAHWPAERREAVLVHELAHVARGDALGHEIGRIAAALYWINPLVWVALRGMRSERERACDDLVLATGTRASSYAGDLLEIARTVAGRRPAAAAALAMARPRELEGRLLAILASGVSRRPASPGVRAAAAALALLLVLPLAALRPAHRQGDADLAEIPGAPSITTPAPGDTRPSIERSAAPRQMPWQPGPTPAAPPAPPAAAPAVEPLALVDVRAPMASEVAPMASEVAPVAVPVAPPADTRTAFAADDLGTLIAVANAAGAMSSDNDKAELLLAVVDRSPRSDSLQRVVLRAAGTIGSGYERQRVLVALLRRGLAEGVGPMFLATAAGIRSAHESGVVLGAFVRDADRLTNPATREAFLRAVSAVTGGFERQQLLGLVIRQPGFDAAAALDVLPLVRSLSSSHEKANLLVAIARRGVTSDPAVREAFLIAGASVSSDFDRRRALESAGLREGSPR